MKNDSQEFAPIEYTRGQLWDMYLEISASERHFNTIQERYRLVSSSWLLATIAAAAYLVVNQKTFEFAPIQILISNVAYFGSIGISLLWIFDVKIYHVLLSAYFVEGLALERGQPWLPPIRRRIRSKFKGQLPMLISVYYIASALSLFLVGTVVLITFVYQHWADNDLFRMEFVLVVTLAMIDVAVIAWVFINSWQTDFTLEAGSAEFSETTRKDHYGQAVILQAGDAEKAVRKTNQGTESGEARWDRKSLA